MSDVHSSSQTLANTSTKLVQGELTWLGCFFLPTTAAELFLYKETKLLIYTYVKNTLPTLVIFLEIGKLYMSTFLLYVFMRIN